MGSILLRIMLGIALLVIFAFWGSHEAKIALEIALAVAFTLVLFISVLVDLGNIYEPPVEKEGLEEVAEGELIETPELEEVETIRVEAESPQEARNP